jgi:hypothetical protein
MTKNRDVNVETGKQGFQTREKTEASTPDGGLANSEVGQPSVIDDAQAFATRMGESTGYDSAQFEVFREDGYPIVRLLNFRDRDGRSTLDEGFDEMVMEIDGGTIENYLEENIPASDLDALIDAESSTPDMVWTVSPKDGLSAYDPKSDRYFYDKNIHPDGERELKIRS